MVTVIQPGGRTQSLLSNSSQLKGAIRQGEENRALEQRLKCNVTPLASNVQNVREIFRSASDTLTDNDKLVIKNIKVCIKCWQTTLGFNNPN